VVIVLDADTQTVLGLQVTALEAAELVPEAKGFGRVLDPAPLAELVVELGRAQLDADASRAALARMKVLKQQDNASEKAFQAAENSFQQNQMAVSAVWFKIKNSWGEKLAGTAGSMVVPTGTQRQPDPVLEGILDGSNVLVRVELGSGEHLEGAPDSARLVALGREAWPVQSWFFDTARTVDPHTQSEGLLFLVEADRPKLVPGMAVTAFVKTGEATLPGVELPRSAVVRFNALTWIYIQTGDETFERKEVALDRPLKGGWFVRQELQPGARVVTTGAQQLLSEELQGQGGN
jgi:hypothetical protein